MEPKKIGSLEELQQRKKELDLEVAVSQRELAHSLGTNRVNLNEFLLKKIALPVGGAIAAAWLAPKIFKKRKPEVIHRYHEKEIVKHVPPSQDDDNPARNHYPVPPPETKDSSDKPSYVTQRPRYQRPETAHAGFSAMATPASPSSSSATSAPAATPPPPPRAKKQGQDDDMMSPKQKKKLINTASLASVARIAVPAVKMIVKTINEHKQKQEKAAVQTSPDSPQPTTETAGSLVIPKG